MKKPKIGIVGYGMVGRAVHAWFTRAAIYSPRQFPDGMEKVNRADIVFLTVPTPYHPKTGYDVRMVNDATRKITGRKIIVLKSTVLPGTTAALQRKFPKHTWLFNPEFLRDKTAVQDFLKPDRQIIGLARNSSRHRRAARFVMKLLPRTPYDAFTTTTEAEIIKLGANCFLATKVVFANMVYELCKRLNADYDAVKEGIGRDPRITTSMMKVLQDGYRGYSGKCFPKDMGALVWYGKKTKHRFPLLEIADATNWKLLPKRQRHR
ncbi:MAG: hypothetical protein V1907_02760 [Candidatus Kerfeldbacteria bacterium]